MGRVKESIVSLLKVRADAVPVAVVLCLFCAQLWACLLSPLGAAIAAVVLLFFSGSVISFQHHHNHCHNHSHINIALSII